MHAHPALRLHRHAAPAASRWRWLQVLVTYAGIGLLGTLDYMTGPQLAFTLIYVLPVVWLGWSQGAVSAAGGASLASMLGFFSDLAWPEVDDPLVYAWNAFTRLTMLLFAGLVTNFVRRERDELAEAKRELEDLARREGERARTDALTGLPNLRAFTEALSKRTRSGQVCLLYVDLDNFKAVNDRYGHASGDDLLRDFARALRGVLGPEDLPARVGGDEFVVALAGATKDDSVRLAGLLLDCLAPLARRYPRAGLGASIGVALLSDPGPEAALRAADAAMYRAKRAGKNRVVIS